MSTLGDLLIKKLKDKMEYHKRSASGQAVASLKERYQDGSIQILGVDYWDNINNGVPSGTNVSISDLDNWVKARQSRYSNPDDWGKSGRIVQKNLLRGDAWINKQPEKLQIVSKVLTENKAEINRMAKKKVFDILKIN